MPCNSDYMEPNQEERNLSKVLALLDELRGKPLDPDTFGNGFGPGYNNSSNFNLSALTAQLCAKLQEVDVTKYSLEMQMWWRDHKIADARRIKSEEAAKKRDSIIDEKMVYQCRACNAPCPSADYRCRAWDCPEVKPISQYGKELRSRAIKKLSPEERKALGVKDE